MEAFEVTGVGLGSGLEPVEVDEVAPLGPGNGGSVSSAGGLGIARIGVLLGGEGDGRWASCRRAHGGGRRARLRSPP